MPTVFAFDTTYTQLPSTLYKQQPPTPVAHPAMVIYNHQLAESLALPEAPTAAMLAGNDLPAGADPIAQAYAGHQFGHFTMLGDGRALLLGEHVTPQGQRWDIQLKGSGRTVFSRGGDGRAALAPMLREYIISESMHALGIPTTRSLAVVATGEPVYRDEPLPGAILTRVAASHIRVGTFQYAAHDPAVLKALADYTWQRHYPQADSYLGLLEAIVDRQAVLLAQWMLVGFIHGVMNTDNMALSGETIDYGPCAFMDAYDPKTVFSSIDRQGRYAYGNQPAIAQWNLARLAETLLPLIHDNPAQAIAMATETVEAFADRYQAYWLAGMRRKLGLTLALPEDKALATDLLTLIHGRDYTNTFRALTTALPSTNPANDMPLSLVELGPKFTAWQQRWHNRLAQEPETANAKTLMDASNPAVIPRNHKVEEALEAAVIGNLAPIQNLLSAMAKPFEETPEMADYRLPTPQTALPYRTFCGT